MGRGFRGGEDQEFKMLRWKCLLYSDSIQKEKFPQAAVGPWKQASKRRLFKFSVGSSQNKNLETEQNGAVRWSQKGDTILGEGMGWVWRVPDQTPFDLPFMPLFLWLRPQCHHLI